MPCGISVSTDFVGAYRRISISSRKKFSDPIFHSTDGPLYAANRGFHRKPGTAGISTVCRVRAAGLAFFSEPAIQRAVIEATYRKGQTMAEYRRPGGHIFEYETLRETGTNLWAADGYLKSDPSVAIHEPKPLKQNTKLYSNS